jgi:hypothetical protein
MYEETLRRKELKGFKSFLGIIVLVYGILALMFIVGYMQKKFGIGYLQYILIAGLVLLGIAILRSLAMEYVYMIGRDRVRILRKIGRKSRVLIEFSFGEIIKYGKRPEVSDAAYGRKKVRAIMGKEGPDTYYIVLAGAVVVLNPSGVFMQKLKEVYEKTYC